MNTKEQLIYAAIIGAAIGDALPTVADFVYFNKQQELKEKLNNGEIEPKEYWKKEALYYYGTNSAYWALIALILYNIKGDYHTKIKAALWIIGGSAVLGILAKNIRKDDEYYRTHRVTKIDDK